MSQAIGHGFTPISTDITFFCFFYPFRIRVHPALPNFVAEDGQVTSLGKPLTTGGTEVHRGKRPRIRTDLRG